MTRSGTVTVLEIDEICNISRVKQLENTSVILV